MKLFWILILLPNLFIGQDKAEIVSPLESRINGTIQSFGKKEFLLKDLGTPSRVENVDHECGITEEQQTAEYQKYYLYGLTQFYVYDEKYELEIIDFKSGKFTYNTPHILLSSKTTFEELQKIFPEATEASLRENKGRLIRLKPCAICDGEVQLLFENGKLIELELWEGC